ncbi:CAP domain-containing protein [Sedimentitalea nanhaiensis]|uniref:Cysteine-rich secretory protein family protein n=1 Tax=Sedimentitalea nanhaiensis TaxID=999627 RepID=A0A1I6YXL0_9RHOB|nr:CAP domain-containing protein [Sedimentitalea nanhaiensis]SFT55199.1 Cysteine-rich secretory protein family protein [Sedimentitalea nanhaiensis]
MSRANELEWLMLDLINDERTAIGLQPLKLDLRLNDSSEDHSSWMLQSDTFSHTGINGSNAGDRMRDADFTFSGSWGWGENIAWQSERGTQGLEDDVANLHASLMNSSGHRANILRPEFETIGIGIEYGDYKGWDAVMVTQNFARTSAPLQLDRPGAPDDQPDPPQDNSAPQLIVDDITVGKIAGARSTRLKKHLEFSDADGDAPIWYELLDMTGRDNFRFAGQGKFDASTPVRIDADDLGKIRVYNDKTPGTSTLQVRASDGTDVSAWEEITLTTLSADDWLAMG